MPFHLCPTSSIVIPSKRPGSALFFRRLAFELSLTFAVCVASRIERNCVPKSSTRPPLSPLKKHLRRFSIITISSFNFLVAFLFVIYPSV